MISRFLLAVPTVGVVLLLILGPAISGRLVSPFWGIGIFLTGGLLGLVAGISALAAGTFALMRGKIWARQALLAAIVPLAGAALVALLFVLRPGPADRFNDVSTDLSNPPSILAGPNAGKPFPPAFVGPHRRAYPDLRTQVSEFEPQRAFAVVVQTAAELSDWELLSRDDQAGDIQLIARTRLFRFEDDVVIRVRAVASGSVIDMRSKSRLGAGDRGANAARIMAFQARLDSYLRGHPTTDRP